MGVSVWEGRFSEYLRRVFGTRESGAFEVLPDVMPVAAVNDSQAPEAYLSRNERLWTGAKGITAAAAQFPTVWVGLPASVDNVLTVVTGMLVSVIATQQVQYAGPLGSVPAFNGIALPNDGRMGVASTLMTRIHNSSEAAALGVYPQLAVLANQALYVPLNVIMRAGQSLAVQGQIANSMLQVVFFGYERGDVGGPEMRQRV